MKSFDMNSCTGIKLNILENFDINNSQDFELAEFLAKKNKLSSLLMMVIKMSLLMHCLF